MVKLLHCLNVNPQSQLLQDEANILLHWQVLIHRWTPRFPPMTGRRGKRMSQWKLRLPLSRSHLRRLPYPRIHLVLR